MKNSGRIHLFHQTNRNRLLLNLRTAKSTLSVCSAGALPPMTHSQLLVRHLRQWINNVTFVSFQKMFFQNVTDSYSNESLSLEWVLFCSHLYTPVAQTVGHGTSNTKDHGFDSQEMHDLIKCWMQCKSLEVNNDGPKWIPSKWLPLCWKMSLCVRSRTLNKCIFFFYQHYIIEGLSLQAPPAVSTPGAALWNQPLSSIFPSTTSVSQSFSQAPVFSTSPVPAWGNIPGSFGTSTATQQVSSWSTTPVSNGSNGSWTPSSTLGNPFQTSVFPPSLVPDGQQSSSPPPLVPPRAVATKEVPKVDSNAFVDLDPLGEKEKRDIKDMFKDFQMAKPPNVPARKGEEIWLCL